jgi:hypothetical protein
VLREVTDQGLNIFAALAQRRYPDWEELFTAARRGSMIGSLYGGSLKKAAGRSGHYAAGTYFAERRPEHIESRPRPRDLAEWMTESHPAVLHDRMIVVLTERPKRKSA